MSRSSITRAIPDLDLIVETIIYLQAESMRQAKAQSQRLGVTATQLNVLKFLDKFGSLSLTEVSRHIAAKNSTTTGIVDRMVQVGLVARQQSEDDRRVWRVRLTERGRKIANKATSAPWDLLRSAFDALDGREQASLVAILRKMAAHVSLEVGAAKEDS